MTQLEETKKALDEFERIISVYCRETGKLFREEEKAVSTIRAALSQSPQGDAVSKEARLYEDALQYLYDFTGSKPIGSTEYQIHMYIYSIFQSAEKGEFND